MNTHMKNKCHGCHFAVTGVTPTHCCNACHRRPGNHGPMCKQIVFQQHHHHHHHHAHHHHHGHAHAHAHCTATPILTGVWMADQGAANQTSIAQAGSNITCTNPGQAWSPATGVVHANRTVTFHTGLVGITGTFDGFNKIVFSNGCSWTKTA
eukprot:TRINITY_DN5939_c0_g2_i1.p1 TRINITY_DN5939_c0_g2~~TRINITY_DN5939_c0_g2_i1.p1  ORF type:complete len:152 (+),score=26.55 TRINITY_DN5939_c0_g2_i1:57-512(+)